MSFSIQTITGGSSGAISINGLSDALYDTTTDHNLVIGSKPSIASGAFQNTVVGEGAFAGVTTTVSRQSTIMGYHAGAAITSGGFCTLVGANAGAAITTGAQHTLIGQGAGSSLVGGSQNVAVGNSALGSSVSGTGNVALGYNALPSQSSSTSNNIGIGIGTAVGLTSSSGNVIIGASAAATIIGGSDNIIIGHSADVSGTSSANRISIGASASCTADNTAQIGNASTTLLTVGTANTASVKALNTAKAYGKSTGATGSRILAAGFNCGTMTDTGIGDLSFTFTTSFANTSYACTVGGERSNVTAAGTNSRDISIKSAGQATGSIALQCWDKTNTTNALKDPTAWHMIAMGTQ